MSMKKNTARRVLGTAMLAAGVLLFTACPREIGLGSAVDTQKPVVTITTPDADSILSGGITVTGTASDDLAIKSVTVTFSSTSEPSLPAKTYEAVVNEQAKTWSLTVDTKDAARGLPDSSYEIVATATDKTNKTSTAARSFQIDNTAPTVLITSPSLYGGNNRTQFCNQIRIEGEAFDISEISAIRVYLCNEAGNVVAGPKEAGGKTSWTALFSSDDLTALADDEVYYFYAVATDKAGNSNTTFFHKADILGLPDGANPVPTIEEISRLDRGVTTGNAARVSASNLQTVRIATGAAGITAGRSSSRGYPDFTYTTQASAAILWTNLGDTAATSVIGVGSAIFATIQPPTDNSAILLDSICVYIRTVEGDDYGEWIEQTSITKQKIGESVNISINPKVNGINLTEGTYEVSLLCNTNSGSSIGSEKGFQVNSDAPKVEESSIYKGSQPATAFAQGIVSGNDAEPKLSGRFLRSNGSVMPTLATGTFSITCKDSSGATVRIYTPGNGITYSGTDGSWVLPLSLGTGAGELQDDTYTFSISGSLGEALTMITRVVTVDTTAPEVSLVSPTADSVITIAQNGTGFTFQGNAVDSGSGIATTYWCIDVAGAAHTSGDTGSNGVANAEVLADDAVPVKGKWYKFSTPTVFNLQPKLSDIYGETNYKAYVFTKDAAGYVSVLKVVPFFIDNAKPEIEVTAWPTLVRQNVTENFTITGRAWDSSGALEKVYVSFDGHDAVEIKDLTEGSYTNGNKASWSFTGSAVSSLGTWSDGTHTLAFTVKDRAGRTSNVVSNTFTIDNVPPTLTVANLYDGQSFESMNTPVSGTAIDALSGVNKVQYSSAGTSTNESSWHDATNDSGAWSINLGNLQSEDSQTIRIRAFDNAGNVAYLPAESNSDISFFIDKANPLATIEVNTTDAVMNGDTVMTTNSFSLKGLANDTAGGTTGREAKSVKLTYTKDGGTAVTAFTAESICDRWKKDTDTADNKTGKWNWSPDTDFQEGFYTFTLTVTDTSNKVTTATKSVRYDRTAPVLVITTPAANESFNTASVTMGGSVTDSGSGVDKIYYTLDGSDPETSATKTEIQPNGSSWTEDISFGSVEGVKTLRMYAVDKIGNASSDQSVTFSYDKENPWLNVLSVSASGLTTNANFKIAGTAWDTNGLDYITVSDGTTTWSSDTARTGAGTVAGVTLTKKTANPGTAEANWNWNLNFGVGSSTSGIHLDDGTATFSIIAKDIAGKTASVTRTVTVDTTAPSIAGASTAATAEVAADQVYLDVSVYKQLTVNATDNGTGLTGVYYQVKSSNASVPAFSASSEDDWTSMALSSSGWIGNIDFTGASEGKHFIFVAAKDNAGNRTVWADSLEVTVDAKRPVITVSGRSDVNEEDIDISITIDDTNPATPSVKAYKPNGTEIGSLSASGSGSSWTVTVPFSSDDYDDDGEYKIIVNETDTRGRQAVAVTHRIKKDKTAPTITIDSPASGMTGDSSLYGSSYLFRGTANDNAGGTGIAKIWYKFTKAETAPAFTEYTQQTATEGTWTITRSFVSGSTGTPSDAETLNEGSWKLYMLAEDKAGNRTDVSEAVVRSFDIDLSAPSLAITKADTKTLTDLTKTYFSKNSSITLTGTASDTNGIALNSANKKYVTVKVGNEASEECVVADNGTWTFTYDMTADNKDVLLTATVTVTDKAGKKAEKSVPLYFDTQAPEITITKPAVNESLSPADGKYTLTGTVADVGAGVSTAAGDATYLIKKGDTTVASGNLTVMGASWTAQDASLGSSEGSLKLTVKIKDVLGQETTTEARTFYYDKSDPKLGNISISSSGLTTNADFTLAGTAWDTNELDCITVSDGEHTWSSAGDSPAVSLVKKTADPGNAAENRNWHIDFGVGSSTSGVHIADGTTTFTITAKDVAGKTTVQTRTVTVDTTAPAVSAVAAAGTGEVPAGKVFLDVSKYKQLTVTAADQDPAENVSGTGLAGVYYKVLAENAASPAFTAATEGSWSALALGGAGWTGNIDFSDKAEGNWKIYVAAKDNAGNRAVYTQDGEMGFVSITVDAKKPVVTLTGKPASGETENPAAAKDTGKKTETFIIHVEDTNPGTPTVTILKPKANGTAGGAALSADDAALIITGPETEEGGKKWTLKVPFGNAAYNGADGDGMYTIVVNETDLCGRVADQKTHTIRKDTTAPAVNQIDAPVENMTGINSLYGTSYLFQGTAKDSNDGSTNCSGLAKILYAFTRTADAPSASQYTELAMADGSWSVTKSLTAGASETEAGKLYEGTWYLHVLAEDKAGNRTPAAERAIRCFDIDMSAPSLAITKADGNTLTDLAKTTYTKGNSFTLEGTATDTNGIAKNAAGKKYVTVQVDDESPVTPLVGSDGTWSFTYNRTDANKDQLHTVTVTAVDVAGKSADKTTSFYFDMTAPSVTITLPTANETTKSNTYSLSGTVADVGAGVAANSAESIAEYNNAETTAERKAELYENATATYIIKKGSTEVAKGLLEIRGAGWKAENVQLGATDYEGKLDLTITIKDELGWATDVERTFYKDLYNPELRVLSVSANGLTTRDNYKIGGIAWDTNELDYITVSDGTTTWSSDVSKSGDGTVAGISLIKKTADPQPGDDESKWNWHLDFHVDGTSGGIAVGDGTKTYTVLVKDVAGNSATATRTVTVDRTAPSITAASASASGGVAADKVFLDVSAYKPVTVTASDAGTGLSSVFYQIVAPAAAAPDTAPAAPTFTSATESNWTSLALTGNDTWSGNADFTGKAEGKQFIFIAAKDKVGNCAVYESSIALTVDAAKPVTTLTGVRPAGAAENPSPVKDTGAKAETFVVHVADTNPTAPAVTILKPKADGTAGGEALTADAAKLTITGPAAEEGGKKWTVKVPFNESAYSADGLYTISVSETDDRGRAADDITHTIRKDTTPPAAAIATPAADLTLAAEDAEYGIKSNRTGDDALFGDSYRFTGTAADNAGGSGLAKILYVFSASGGAPAAGSYTELEVTDENWTITKDLIEGKTAVTNKLNEGTWYLHVLAEDKAGNRTASENRAIRKFDIDLKAPELAITKAGGVTLTEQNRNETRYTNKNSIKIEGTATDTNGIAKNAANKKYVTVKVGSADAVEALVADNGTWEYTCNQTADNKDKLLTITVTVTDVAGKTAVQSVPVYFDTQAPSVSIAQPADGITTDNNNCALSGTVVDFGAGVAGNTAAEIAEYAATATTAARKNEIFTNAKATYSITNEDDDVVAKGLLTLAGANWSANVDLDANTLEKKEGELTLTVAFKDTLGNAGSEVRTFFYDKTPPDLTETGVGPSLTTSSEFTFSGTASDTNALKDDDAETAGIQAIRITATKDGGSTNVIDDKVTVDASNHWSKTYTPDEATLADGSYNFTITVTDVANRTKSLTSTVKVDTSAPTITRAAGKSSFLTDTPTANGSWFKKEYLGLKAVVVDNAGGSGVSMVEYAVSSGETAPASWTADTFVWNPMTKGDNNTYTANVQVAGGKNYICIRATDVANNVTYRYKAGENEYVSTQEMAKVDLSAPSIAGVYTDADCTEEALDANKSYLTRKKALELYLKTSDFADVAEESAGSGIDSLKVKINEHEVTAVAVTGTTDTFKLAVSEENLNTYLNNSDNSYTVSAVAEDIAGNKTTVSQLFTIQYDKTPPIVAFSSPAEETADPLLTLNKKVVVAGTTTESQSLESVNLYIVKNGSDILLESFSGNDMFNWKKELDTFAAKLGTGDDAPDNPAYIADTGTITLKAVAADKAGNTTTKTLQFAINQANDCPEITINNVNFSGMKADTPVWLVSNKVIYGSVADDDGSIKTLKMGTISGSSSEPDWTEIPVTNGSFTKSLDTDGEYTIVFYVKDKNDTEFTTNNASALSRPVLKGSDDVNASDEADNILYLIVDTHEPAAPAPTFSLTGENDAQGNSTWTADLLSQKIFSKSLTDSASETGYNSFWVRQMASDANGIDTVLVAIGSDEDDAFVDVQTIAGTEITEDGAYTVFKFQVTADQIEAASSGTQTLNIRVKDNAGMTQKVSATFSIDNDAPVIDITSHADGDDIKKSFYLVGTTSDAPKMIGAKTLLYKVTGSETLSDSEDWTPIATTLTEYGAHAVKGANLSSWRVYFDDDVNNAGEYTHDRLLKKILVSIPGYRTEYNEADGTVTSGFLKLNSDGKVVYSRDYHDNVTGINHDVDSLYTEITPLYIHFKSIDACGNESYACRILNLDPQGDIPTAAITYPDVQGYAWRCATNSKVYYTKELLPVVGSKAYGSIDDITKSNPATKTITGINRTNKTIRIDSNDYTYYGGETVQGGIVRIQGTADGENAISKVYIQIDPTYDAAVGFQWNNGVVNGVPVAGNALLPDGTKLNEVTNNPYPISVVSEDKTGIEAGTSASWSFSLNKREEFKAAAQGEKNYVGVRAFSVDIKGNISPYTDVIILTIDADTPRIGTSEELYLYRYENNENGTGAVLASQKYTDGMWLKDEWWLVGSVEDSNGIKSFTIDGKYPNGSEIPSEVSSPVYFGYAEETDWNSEGAVFVPDPDDPTVKPATSGYIFKFKIGSTVANTFGQKEYVLFAEDKDAGSSKTVSKTISINFDNKKPELAPVGSVNYNIQPIVQQSNGFYTLRSAVTENADEHDATLRQSGFERLALYFVRRGNSVTGSADRLYDTYFLKSETQGGNTVTNDIALSTLENMDGLYWKTQTVTRNPDFLNKFTLSSADRNIHVGGLVKIGGAMYIIKSINGTTLEISGSPAILNNDPTKANYRKEPAYFAMAMIVDHELSENVGGTLGPNGYYTDVGNDDGDCMVEEVNTQGTTTTWKASINSRNIPDGAIEIHYVAFDKAGNYAEGVVDGTVSNNTPRIAGVRYGADNNGDGNITGNEIKQNLFGLETNEAGAIIGYKTDDGALRTSYVLGTKNGGSGSPVTLSNPKLKVKGAIQITPEIVGGNGDLWYEWSVTKNGASAPYYSVGVKKFGAGIKGTDYSGSGAVSEVTGNAVIKLSLKDLLTKSNNVTVEDDPKTGANAGPQLFTFTIWDSTEDMTPGVNSGKAVVELVANVKLKDQIPPEATVKPFYWNNNANNSIYKQVGENNKVTLNGHIDLSADLPHAKDDAFSATGTGVYDLDDKVSGAIVIEGTATDDTLLSGLYMKLYVDVPAPENKVVKQDRFTFTGATAIDAAALTAMGVTSTDDDPSPLLGYYKVASYDNGWTCCGNYETNGWSLTISNSADTFDETGHTTHWTLTLNTEKLSAKAIADLKLSVLATDKGVPTLSGANVLYVPNSSTADVEKTTNAEETAFNQFDVVPYIRSVTTALAGRAGDEFARSATGRYTVTSGESILIYGWNLDLTKVGGALQTTVKLDAADMTVSGTGTDATGSYLKTTVGSASGSISVVTGGINSLNNVNNNSAVGVPKNENKAATVDDTNYETYAYNRKPNGITNNRLSDDVKIWTWNFDKFVDGTNITSPMMKLDGNGNWYMSYGKGTPSMVVNINGNERSVDYSYNKFHNTNVTFDASGRIWSVAMNTDRIKNDSSRFVLYAPLGSNNMPAEIKTGTTYMTPSTSKRHMELAYTTATGEYDIDRVKNSKMVTTQNSEGKTFLAMAYYDGNNKINPVKFRFGSYGRSVEATDVTLVYNNKIKTYKRQSTWSSTYVEDSTVAGWTNSNTGYSGMIIRVDGTEYTLARKSYTNSSGGTSYYYTIANLPTDTVLSNIQLYGDYGLAGGISDTVGAGAAGSDRTELAASKEAQSNDPTQTDSSASGYHIVASNNKNTTFRGGSHVAVGIVPDETATNGYVGVVAWYDANAKRLAFSYNTDPDTPQVAGNVAEGTVDQWNSHAFYVDEIYAGWYVDMAVDAAGHIHLAYYDSKSGDLKYAYLEDYKDTTPVVTTIDSYLSVGTNISMTVREEPLDKPIKVTGKPDITTKQVPYIYYYNASATQTTNSVRVAWQEEDTLADGASGDKFTGAWEVMTVPTEHVPVDAAICGGTPNADAENYAGQVVLGYMTEACYERAVLLK